jgi:hypothetical protein
MSTLSSLRKIPANERATILARMVAHLSPSPTEDDPSKLDPVTRAVESDLKKMFGVASLEDPAVRAKALRFLSSAIREATLPNSAIEDARERAGTKGSLPLDLYKIEFGNSFTGSSESLGVTKAEVRAAVRSPDGVQHYHDEFVEFGYEATTLLVKHFFTDDPYTLIVVAGRIGATLRIDGAWKSFYKDVPSSALSEPVQFLRSYLDIFGFPVKIYSKRAKLIVYESFPRVPGADRFEIDVDSNNEPFDARSTYHSGVYQVHITLAFAINLFKYVDCLKAHGVRITRELPARPKGGAGTS